jgi:hypothetical protein
MQGRKLAMLMILMHQLRLVLLHTCVKPTPITIMVY